jgi:lysozyme family protein
MTIETLRDELIEDVIGREGGYANHPADKGGPTRWGITEAVARAHDYNGEMRVFSRVEAIDIYRRLYWTKPGLDRVATIMPRLAAELFDTGVNMGPATAAGFLRRALNALNRNSTDFDDLPSGGMIDDSVILALTKFKAKRGGAGEAVLIKAVEALQGERYIRLTETRPANEAFLYGWITNRIG